MSFSANVLPIEEQRSLIDQMLDNDLLKYGEFELKNGGKSQYYIDLREATLYPALFHDLVEAVKKVIPKEKHYGSEDWKEANERKKKYAIVGVPYGVVPLAGAVAHELKIPYIPIRKEQKDYGNQSKSPRLDDYKIILIEDVMSTGRSIVDTLVKLGDHEVSDIIVLVDREAGGIANIHADYPNTHITSLIEANRILSIKNERKKDVEGA